VRSKLNMSGKFARSKVAWPLLYDSFHKIGRLWVKMISKWAASIAPAVTELAFLI